jgi:hypothetical protein
MITDYDSRSAATAALMDRFNGFFCGTIQLHCPA